MPSQSLQQQLKYVKVSRADAALDRFPDFLIVGPQRTGTTWLHANLRFHPEIFLAEPKELFFFSRLTGRDKARAFSDDLVWYLSFFRDPLWRFLLKQGMSLARYQRFYRPKIRGEATASYAAVPPDVIADIAVLNPRLKVIMMVRDPIDRAWSHAKKDLVRNRGRRFEEVDASEFEEFFRDDYQLRCARYAENLNNWSAHFPASQIFVGLFDDINSRPEALLEDVMDFLGVSSDPSLIPNSVREAVNPTASSSIPETYKTLLESILAKELRVWHSRFAAAPRSFVLDAEGA